MIGKTVGKYRIVGPLGRGGMGTVYKAVDQTLDREVAIKVLNPEIADTKIMKRFRAEATTLAKLNHPEIATIYELFRSETDLLIVMEFVRGETLEKISVRLGALPPDAAAYLIDKVLSALEHAHRAGIVHCDIKPANVMVTGDGGVKIMDFGTARVRGAEHGTADGYMMGTPAYMSPEQVLGQELDGRTDLYAAGVVFYRLLTGALPFDADTAIAMVQKQISDAPTPLRAHREGLPAWCETILQRALAKSPADRFQTAEEFRETLGKATGIAELTTAFSISIEDAEMTEAAPSPALEHFGPTRVLGAPVQASVFAGLPYALAGGSAGDARDTPSVISGTNPAVTSAQAATMVLPRRDRSRLTVSPIVVLTGGVMIVLVIVALRRPVVTPTAATSSARAAPAAANTTLPPPARPGKAADNAVAAADNTVAAPFVFQARALVRDGDRQRDRKSRVALADGKISIRANDNRDLLYVVPYDEVLSIGYSRGRDPVWNAPGGPTRVARAGGGVFGAVGIFVKRDWVSLRTAKAKAPFVVLRFDDETQARRAIAALEERTGRSAEFVPDQQE